jgi:hypothetical protein
MRAAAVLLLVLSSLYPARAQKQPQYQPPLISSWIPDCSERLGTRDFRSETAKTKDTSIYFTGQATRDRTGCHMSAMMRIDRGQEAHVYPLPDASDHAYTLADFPPDGSQFLLDMEDNGRATHKDDRDMRIAVVPVSSPEMHWHDAWDIFQWRDSDATVNPESFADDGTVILLALPSIVSTHTLPNCAAETILYSVNLATHSVERLESGNEIRTHGEDVGGRCLKYKANPDLVGACFTVHSRMSIYNGAFNYRIWRIGTHRMLGVRDVVVPDTIAAKLDWDNVAYGDSYVCPLTRNRPEHMQMICVESVSNVTYKK